MSWTFLCASQPLISTAELFFSSLVFFQLHDHTVLHFTPANEVRSVFEGAKSKSLLMNYILSAESTNIGMLIQKIRHVLTSYHYSHAADPTAVFV